MEHHTHDYEFGPGSDATVDHERAAHDHDMAAGVRHPRTMYARLGLMLGLSFIWMYAAMFAMVDSRSDIEMNLNFVYMALLMAAPMGLLEVLIMTRMYPDARWNAAIAVVSVAVLAVSLAAIRTQAAVGDEQFLRSMIPHHSGAIPMCQESSLDDAAVQELCGRIVQNQRQEIQEMEALLDRVD